MNLMGYLPEEGEALVRSFSGGWKMRIGLGKVLLKDPNILLLDEVSLLHERLFYFDTLFVLISFYDSLPIILISKVLSGLKHFCAHKLFQW